jgi:YD repeat-containing protein
MGCPAMSFRGMRVAKSNQHAALSKPARITVSGGTVTAYVWDYAGKMISWSCFGMQPSNSIQINWDERKDSVSDVYCQ